ncbi:MAG: hypothetical protein A3G87_07970 [Omnitrophica bacterium RIFCSPLOWO2_12_FULL_50_11]|nr:MAG: hypothetical protein A3G87_07970 [Omnitrophica bacterium RIFCSPLOWO2_12_FULL_50_11]
MSASKRSRSLGLNITGPVQRTFILLEFILLMLTMIYLLYLIFTTIESVAGPVDTAKPFVLEDVLDRINFLLLTRISVLFLVVFVVNVLLGLFYLHRLTGPLVRITAVLTQIAHGKVPTRAVTLRRGDFPTDVSDALSKALERIRQWQR